VSFSLEVFATVLPQDLWAGWADALAAQGLVVERHPGFLPERWRGGWVGFKVVVEEASSSKHRYPKSPIAAGFELDVGPNEEGADLARQAPASVASLISEARTVFHLSTPAARTVADLRLQCLAAATLASITRGAVYDPQQAAFFAGEAAVANARREIEQYEDNPESIWTFEHFK
jgi:hypothetical protein